MSQAVHEQPGLAVVVPIAALEKSLRQVTKRWIPKVDYWKDFKGGGTRTPACNSLQAALDTHIAAVIHIDRL